MLCLMLCVAPLCVHEADNTVRENKNANLILYLNLLASKGLFRSTGFLASILGLRLKASLAVFQVQKQSVSLTFK